MIHTGKAEQQAQIGVISDTHGYLHPAVPDLFHPVRQIVHAGDIGRPDILAELGRIAPVTAVRGNMDSAAWAAALPVFDIVEFESLRICVLHDLDLLDFDPHQAGISAVISGHTHSPHLTTEDGVMFINPGSASHPRYRHSPTVALLQVFNGNLSARFIELTPKAT